MKSKVVWRSNYWLPNEVTSIYGKAHAVISLENHSPILALTQGTGTPVIFIRQPTDTIKGAMWKDVGLGDWFFDADAVIDEALWQRLESITRDYPGARARADKIIKAVQSKQSAAIRF